MNFWYEFRKFLVRGSCIGILGYVVEIFSTGIIHYIRTVQLEKTLLVSNISDALMGTTGILAFFVYFWAVIPFTFLAKPMYNLIPNTIWKVKGLGVFFRGLIWGLIVMTVELIVGIIVKSVWGWDKKMVGWDFSNMPLNILGLTTFSLYPAWAVAGMIGEWFHLMLDKVDDIVVEK